MHGFSLLVDKHLGFMSAKDSSEVEVKFLDYEFVLWEDQKPIRTDRESTRRPTLKADGNP